MRERAESRARARRGRETAEEAARSVDRATGPDGARTCWIVAEVVDALGQTHLALKQLRHTTTYSCSAGATSHIGGHSGGIASDRALVQYARARVERKRARYASPSVSLYFFFPSFPLVHVVHRYFASYSNGTPSFPPFLLPLPLPLPTVLRRYGTLFLSPFARCDPSAREALYAE